MPGSRRGAEADGSDVFRAVSSSHTIVCRGRCVRMPRGRRGDDGCPAGGRAGGGIADGSVELPRREVIELALRMREGLKMPATGEAVAGSGVEPGLLSVHGCGGGRAVRVSASVPRVHVTGREPRCARRSVLIVADTVAAAAAADSGSDDADGGWRML